MLGAVKRSVTRLTWRLRTSSNSTGRRQFSASSLPFLHDGPTITLLHSTDPKWNLAYEDYMLDVRRKTGRIGRDIMLWRNSSSVILGRNQNPFIECNSSLATSHGIPLVRRHSGGGTVYHDLGNTNITLFGNEHQPEKNLSFVIRAINNVFGLQAYISPRKDIFIDQKKISGSAYRLTGNQCYHHLTLLREADLDLLEQILQSPLRTSQLETRATESVRSKVVNVSTLNHTITHDSLCNAIINEFRRTKGVIDGDQQLAAASPLNQIPVIELHTEQLMQMPELQDRYKELGSWDWTIGHTPEFSHTVEHSFPWGFVTCRFKCHKGVITECSFDSPIVPLSSHISSAVVDCRYSGKEVASHLTAPSRLSQLDPTLHGAYKQVIEWLSTTLPSWSM